MFGFRKQTAAPLPKGNSASVRRVTAMAIRQPQYQIDDVFCRFCGSVLKEKIVEYHYNTKTGQLSEVMVKKFCTKFFCWL